MLLDLAAAGAVEGSLFAEAGAEERAGRLMERVDGVNRSPERPVSPEGVRARLEREAVLLVFGTGHGLAPQILEAADGTLAPVRRLDRYRHLSVRSAASIAVDRILGDAY